MRIEWRGRNVSSLGSASKQCMMASRAGMGSFGPNKSSMSIKSSCGVVLSVQCWAERSTGKWAVTCDRRSKGAGGLRSHQTSRGPFDVDKAEFVSPSGPRVRSLGEVDQPPICCFVGPEARLAVMRGDVCVSCLWESLDGMIWSACRCDVPLHLSDVRVESTYLHLRVSGLPRTEVCARCVQYCTEIKPTTVAVLGRREE